MAKVVDPDDLNRATEYQYDTTTPSARTFQLLVAGNLDDASPGATSGVTLQCMYSRQILDFAANTAAGTDLRKHTFPISMRTESEGTWNPNWGPADAQTRELIRDGGWTENNGDIYPGFVQLDSTDADTDQATYQWVPGGTATVSDFDKTGQLNEALIQQSGGTYFQVRLRVQGKTHASFEAADFFGTVLTGKLFNVLLANSSAGTVESDANIDANAPYTGMSLDYLTGDHTGITTRADSTPYVAGDIVQVPSGAYSGRYLRCTVGGTSGVGVPSGPGADGSVTWEADPGERQIGANYFHFSRVVAGNSGSAVEIRDWGQRQLRLLTDVNANINGDAFGSVNGVNAEELFGALGLPPNQNTTILTFTGAVLEYARGVYVDAIDGADLNNQRYRPHFVDGAPATGADPTTGEVTNPFKANLKIIVPSSLVGGICTVYFQNDDAGDNTGRDFDTDDAIVVQDDVLADVDFVIGATETDFTYDYDANVQRGAASAGAPAPVIAHALKAGPSGVIPVTGVATITQVDNVDLRLTAQDDTVFNNP
jgi:hypothetical protein